MVIGLQFIKLVCDSPRKVRVRGQLLTNVPRAGSVFDGAFRLKLMGLWAERGEAGNAVQQ